MTRVPASQPRLPLLLAFTTLVALIAIPALGQDDDEAANRSRFAGQLDPVEHPEAKAPENAPSLRWDFGEPGEVARYRIEQTNRNLFKFGGEGSVTPALLEGVVRVVSVGGNRAEFVFDEMAQTIGADENARQVDAPTTTVEKVGEDGKVEGGDFSTSQLVGAFLPIPADPAAMATGETVETEFVLPINFEGMPRTATGIRRETLTGYHTVNGRLCARVETSVVVDGVDDVPEGIETFEARHCSVRLVMVTYHDVESRTIEAHRGAVRIRVEARTKMQLYELDTDQMMTTTRLREE